MAAWILGERREQVAVPALMALLARSTEPGTLEFAVEALGKIGDPSAVPLLSLNAVRWPLRVRVRVVEALGHIGGREAELTLSKMVDEDPSPLVRDVARRVLHIPGKEGGPAL